MPLNVGSGKALYLQSLDIGHATDMTEADSAWTLTINKVGNGQVFSMTTAAMGAGDKEHVNFNFMGQAGSNYILKFNDNGAGHVRACIDNLKFSQIDTTNWDNNYALSGSHGIGVLSHSLTGLTTGADYYYIAKATNSAGTSWGPVKTFKPANTSINKYSIPGLALWLDAIDLNGDGNVDNLSNGTAVATWTDKSLENQTVSQSASNNQPVIASGSFGSKPGVRFDGNGDILNVSSIRTTAGGYTVYALTRRAVDSGDANAHLISESSWALIPSTTNSAFTAKVAKKSAASGSTLTNIKLGKSASSSSNDFGGDLAELLLFTRQLTTQEEHQVEGYLAHKWGAADSLDSNHTYKDVPPIFNNGPRIEELSGVVFHPVHASVFMGPNPSSGHNNLDGATYSYSSSRVFNGSKGLLAHTGDSHNIQLSNANTDIQNWNHFPAFSGGNNFMTAISGSFLATNTGAYTFRWSNDDAGAMYIDLDHDGTFAASENLAPFAWDGSGTLELVAGTVYNFFYMTAEGGGGDSNNWYITQPGGSEERVNLGKPSQIAMWSAPSVDAILTTGKSISLQVPASRNPTSWTATGLASGLSINNSGVITGSTAFIGDFNATFTATNSDGNDSKTFSFNVIKGRRVIDWNQTIAGKSYGDAPFALTATKTGTDTSLANFPNTLPGMKLWLDASSLSSAGSTWSDKSPADNDATKVGSPSVATNAQNGLSVMSYSGATSESHAFTTITDIRTVFWVVSEDSSVSGSGLRYLLGDTVEPDWHTQGDGNIWGHQWGEPKVYNGYTRLNGVPIDGRVTAKPTSLSILTIRTTSNARATSFSNDRNAANRSWKGKLGELLIFNAPLDDDQMQRMEGYLAQKWGLTSSLPTNHPYLTVSPAAFRYSSSNPDIIDINGSTAIIKSGGSVVITAHAPANTSAHSAIPVSQSVSIAKAPLTITGDDLSITQGASIPDLNYTISGWKHNDSLQNL